MDGLSVAASVIAVVDISVKVVTSLSKYSAAVTNARDEISSLEREINGLKTTLGHAQSLISAQGGLLPSSRDLKDHLAGCLSMLQKLDHKLEHKADGRGKRKFWVRALKWPFSREEIESAVTALDKYNKRITDGLLIDNTAIVLETRNMVEQLSLSDNSERPIVKKRQFMVPFPRDLDFVPRPAIQNWVHQQLQSETTRIALLGMGGFGKSQIAIELAYEIRSTEAETSVYWVHAHTKSTFEESYRSIANRLDLPGRHDPKQNILALVRDELEKGDIPPWLIILDNADNLAVLYGRAEDSPIASYLPSPASGKILVTSRNLNVAERLVGTEQAIKQLETMDSEEALLLLQKKLNHKFDKDVASDLVKFLDCVPLAISQACAYIHRRRISIDEYIGRFLASDEQKTRLLTHDGGDIRRHCTASNAIAATWLVTFEQLRQESPAAANLLSLLSCFQPQNIPRHMLSGYNGEDIKPEDGTLEDDLDVLFAYSLLRNTTEPKLYEMHSLVQVCTRAWFSNAKQISRWDSHFLQQASKHFPSGYFDTWAQCQLVLPHVERLLPLRPEKKNDTRWWATLLINVSRYLGERGEYSRALALARESAEAQRELLGVDHLETLEAQTNLSELLSKAGRYEESVVLATRITEIHKRSLGVQNSVTLASMVNLAIIVRRLGRLKEAEDLFTEVLEISKTKFGPCHAYTISAMVSLAVTYAAQYRWEEAYCLQVQIVYIHKAALGIGHPDTLDLLHSLATTLMMLGRADNVKKIELAPFRAHTSLLGTDHPQTIQSVCMLAWVYRMQGRLADAERLQLSVVARGTALLGAEHPSTLYNMSDLAGIYMDQGRWAEAVQLAEDATARTARTLGAEHPDTLTSKHTLGTIYRGQGRLEEARAVWEDCCVGRRKMLGPEHMFTQCVEECLREVQEAISKASGGDSTRAAVE